MQNFQEIEEHHLVKMKQFVLHYAIALESSYQLVFEVSRFYKQMGLISYVRS